MEKLVGKFLSAFVNFLFVVCSALSLTKGDVRIALGLSLAYSLVGLVLSEFLPRILLKRGTVSKEEAKHLSTVLLFAWVVAVFQVIPKLLR